VWPFVTVPFDRLFDFEDEDGIESDARPLYTPVNRLCGILDVEGGSLITDLDVHTPPEQSPGLPQPTLVDAWLLATPDLADSRSAPPKRP
jgi:hypothetical protein